VLRWVYVERRGSRLQSASFVLLIVPAALAAVWLAWRRAPVLSLIAGALSLVGWTSIVIMVGQDSLIAEAARSSGAHAQAIALTNAWTNSGAVNFYTLLFVGGHLVGTVFLGAALWRSRAIPRWAAVCVGVSMPMRNNVSNILTKLQVAHRAQAIVRAREAGLGVGRPGG
jgi:hypothetical protein